MNDPCSSSLCLNLGTTAGFHAMTMGVLAGFASAAIVLAVQSEERSLLHRTARIVAVATLFAAVLLFIVASFLYGTAAGAQSTTAQPASMILVTALVALPAIAGLFLGLVSLIIAALPVTQSWATRLVATLITVFTMTYMAISAANVVRVQSSARGYAALCWAAILSSLILVGGVLLRSLRRWDEHWSREGASGLNQQLRTLAWISAGLAIVGVTLFVLLLERLSLASVVLYLVIVILASWVVFILFFISSVHALHREMTLLREDTLADDAPA